MGDLLTRMRARLRGEGGTSLVEMVIVTAVLGVVLAIAFGGFSAMSIESSGADARLQNLDEARVLMANTTRDLRTATPLTSGTSAFLLADAREVKFYANLDMSVKVGATYGPNIVRLYINTSNPAQPYLVEELTKPDATSVPPAWTYSGAPAVRFVGKYVVNSGTQPIFTYYDSAGAVLGPTPLSAANMLAIKAVGVQFVVRRSASNYLPPTTVVNRVTLPNIYYQPAP